MENNVGVFTNEYKRKLMWGICWTVLTAVLASTAAAVNTGEENTTNTVVSDTATISVGNETGTVVWQVEMNGRHHGNLDRPFSDFEPAGSVNQFTYGGNVYTIDFLRVYNHSTRISTSPSIVADLPGGSVLRFWPVGNLAEVQTIRLDAGWTLTDGRWDIIWPRDSSPVNTHRDTTWHIDLVVPDTESASGSCPKAESVETK